MWLLPILVAAIGLSDATRHSHHRQHRQSSHRATSPKSGFFTLDNGRSVKIATPKPSEDVSASGVENVRTLFPIRYQWNGAVMTDPVVCF